jgi:peroxiredoxin
MREFMKKSLLILMSILLTLACQKTPEISGALDFTVNDLSGNEVKLSQYRGQLVLLNIWATWCGPCVREIPDLNALHHSYKDKNVVVLGVSVDAKMDDVKQALNSNIKIDYAVWFANQDFIKQFQISSIPHTMIIDKNGFVVQQMIGMQSKETFEGAIQKALK